MLHISLHKIPWRLPCARLGCAWHYIQGIEVCVRDRRDRTDATRAAALERHLLPHTPIALPGWFRVCEASASLRAPAWLRVREVREKPTAPLPAVTRARSPALAPVSVRPRPRIFARESVGERAPPDEGRRGGRAKARGVLPQAVSDAVILSPRAAGR